MDCGCLLWDTPVSSPVYNLFPRLREGQRAELRKACHKTKPGYKLVWEESPLYPVTRNPWMDALNLQATDAPSLWPYPTHIL